MEKRGDEWILMRGNFTGQGYLYILPCVELHSIHLLFSTRQEFYRSFRVAVEIDIYDS